MKTILVPTDFSENANNALEYAAQLAGHTHSNMLLYHNIEIQAGLPGNNMLTSDFAFNTAPIYSAGAPLPPELENAYQERLTQLAREVEQRSGAGITVNTICRWGSLTENLNEICLEQAVDLVVMGTQGASSFLERLIGTNTASFIKVANTPVLVIPTNTQFKPPKSVAYAADLENDEVSYLQQLNTFAQLFTAEITLVNVKSKHQLNIVVDEQIADEIWQAYPDKNYRIIQLKNDDIADGLEAFVQENRFDLLAVAIHERGFMESLFHNSISEKLAYSSTIPLLTLPQKSA